LTKAKLIGVEVLILLGATYLLKDRGWVSLGVFWALATAFCISYNRMWRWLQRSAARQAG
jgi:hypothetical protein